MKQPQPKIYPVADGEITLQIFGLIEIASSYRLVKKGANESIKALKKGLVDLVIIAYDADPIEITLHLPLLCEDKDVPYVFVGRKQQLGKACGMTRGVIACSVLSGGNSELQRQIDFIKNRIEIFISK